MYVLGNKKQVFREGFVNGCRECLLSLHSNPPLGKQVRPTFPFGSILLFFGALGSCESLPFLQVLLILRVWQCPDNVYPRDSLLYNLDLSMSPQFQVGSNFSGVHRGLDSFVVGLYKLGTMDMRMHLSAPFF